MVDPGSHTRASLLERHGRRVEVGTAVYAEADAATEVYWLHEGRIRLSKRVRSVERNVSVVKPGGLFGVEAFLDGSVRGSTATALTDAVVLALPPSAVVELAGGSPELATVFLGELARRVRETEDQLENAMLKDAPSRVVNALSRLSGIQTADVRLPVSPIELSSLAGLEVESVKRVIQQLRDGGYVQIVEENVVIPDADALKRLFAALSAKEEVRGG